MQSGDCTNGKQGGKMAQDPKAVQERLKELRADQLSFVSKELLEIPSQLTILKIFLLLLRVYMEETIKIGSL